MAVRWRKRSQSSIADSGAVPHMLGIYLSVCALYYRGCIVTLERGGGVSMSLFIAIVLREDDE